MGGSIRNYNKQITNRLPVDPHHTSPFPRTQHILGVLAKISFFATLVLMPVRMRIVLLARPNGALYRDYTDFLLFIPDITLLVTLTAWGLVKFADRKPIRFGPAYVWIPLAGLTVAGLLSVVFSVDRSLSLFNAIRLGVLFLFYLYVVNEKISIIWITAAIALQGAFQAIVAVAQSVNQRSIGLQVLGEHVLDPLTAGVSIVSDGSTRFLRAYGLTDHPNILGGCLAFGLLILLTVYLQSEPKNSLVVGVAFVLMCVALLLTFSRAAWLVFLTGSTLIVGLDAWFRQRKNLKPVLSLMLSTCFVLLPFLVVNIKYLGARLNVGQSFENIRVESQSVNERAFLNQSANQIFVKHPLTGIGLSASPVAMKNEYPEFPTYYQPPHFVLLAVALETGMFGATFYFLLMALPWIVLLRHKRTWTNPNLIGAAGLLLAVTVVGFFDYYTWFSTAGRLWQWLAWGLFAVAIDSPLPQGEGLGVREK